MKTNTSRSDHELYEAAHKSAQALAADLRAIYGLVDSVAVHELASRQVATISLWLGRLADEAAKHDSCRILK